MRVPLFPVTTRPSRQFPGFVLCALLFAAAGLAKAADDTAAYGQVGSGVSFADVQALDYREADHTLSYGSDPLQFGSLWLPVATDPQPAALVVLIHGGCWMNAYDMAHTYALSTALAQAGYAVWSLEYRRTGDNGGGWPGTYEDVLAGIAYIDSLTDYAVDPERFVIAGHSAGGHLALLAGREYPQASGILGLAAITDIESYASGNSDCETAAAQFMGGPPAEGASAYAEANPSVLEMHDTTILLHGGEDTIVSVNQALLIGARTLFVEGGGHFDWVHPGTRSVNLLVSTLQNLLPTGDLPE